MITWYKFVNTNGHELSINILFSAIYGYYMDDYMAIIC